MVAGGRVLGRGHQDSSAGARLRGGSRSFPPSYVASSESKSTVEDTEGFWPYLRPKHLEGPIYFEPVFWLPGRARILRVRSTRFRLSLEKSRNSSGSGLTCKTIVLQ